MKIIDASFLVIWEIPSESYIIKNTLRVGMRSSRQGVYYFVTARAQIAQLCNLFKSKIKKALDIGQEKAVFRVILRTFLD